MKQVRKIDLIFQNNAMKKVSNPSIWLLSNSKKSKTDNRNTLNRFYSPRIDRLSKQSMLRTLETKVDREKNFGTKGPDSKKQEWE